MEGSMIIQMRAVCSAIIKFQWSAPSLERAKNAKKTGSQMHKSPLQCV